MRHSVGVLSIAVLSVLPTAAIADSGMPEGSFTCMVLLAERLTGTSADRFAPSVLGTFSFDGLGHYTREGKSGGLERRGAEIRFVSGEAQGIVAVIKMDRQGRNYMHIDGEVTVPPSGDPKPADFVCYQQ